MSLRSDNAGVGGRLSHAPSSILLVDDEKLFRASAARALRMRFPHTRIDAVADGREALDALAEQDYEVVVTDLHMPGMTGLDLILDFVGFLVDHLAGRNWLDLIKSR